MVCIRGIEVAAEPPAVTGVWPPGANLQSQPKVRSRQYRYPDDQPLEPWTGTTGAVPLPPQFPLGDIAFDGQLVGLVVRQRGHEVCHPWFRLIFRLWLGDYRCIRLCGGKLVPQHLAEQRRFLFCQAIRQFHGAGFDQLSPLCRFQGSLKGGVGGEEVFVTTYPTFQTALKSAERRKLIEPGAVELADSLAKEKSPLLREMLRDEFSAAQANAPVVAEPKAKDEPEPRMADFVAALTNDETYELAIERYIAKRELWRERHCTGCTGPWLQWLIVWVSVLTAAHFWLGLEIGAWWPNPGYRWGLCGYLYPAYTNHASEFAFVILIVGGLLFWQVSSRRLGRTPVGFIVGLSTKTLVVACLVVLLFLAAFPFRS